MPTRDAVPRRGPVTDVVVRRWWHADLRDDDAVLLGRMSAWGSTVEDLCHADPERHLHARRMMWLQIFCGATSAPLGVLGLAGLDPRLHMPWWGRLIAVMLLVLPPIGLHCVLMPLAWWRWARRNPRRVHALR